MSQKHNRTRKKQGKEKPSTYLRQADTAPQHRVAVQKDLLCWCILLLCGVLLYGHTLNAPWYLDDATNIIENLTIRSLSAALGDFFSPRGPVIFSFAVNYWLTGLSLPGLHVTNIAIHVVTSGLVYLVAKRVFPGRPVFAILAAAIFLAHPLQTQAVTYIVQRMASLAALFGFLSLYLYIRGRERQVGCGSWGDPLCFLCWAGSLLAGALAVLSKQNMAILPLAIALFDYFYIPNPDGQSWWTRKRLLYLAPFLIVPFVLAAQQLLVPLSEGISMQKITSTHGRGTTPLYYLVTEFSVVWLYFRLLVFPYPQLLDYVYPVTKELLNVQSLIAGSCLIALMVGAFIGRRRYPHLSFGLFWFMLGIAVESTFIPLDPVFEHRLYFSMFGFSVFLMGVMDYFLPSRTIIPVSLICLLIFGGLTWRRNQVWNDSLELYLDNLKYVNPDDGFYMALSNKLIERKRFSEAVVFLKKASEAGIINPGIYLNLAIAYRAQGEVQKAADVISEAIGRGAKYAELRLMLAQVYQELSEYGKAEETYKQLLDDNPDSVQVLFDLGVLIAAQNRFDEAESYLRRALEQQSDSTPIKLLLGYVLGKSGRIKEAEALFRQVVSVEPDNKDAWFSLGTIGLRTGDQNLYQDALKKLEKLEPESAAKLAGRRQGE